MSVRVEGARTAVLQLDDFQAGDRLPDEPVVSAASVEFLLPKNQYAVADAVLKRFELERQLRMQQRGDAVRLGVIQRSVK